MAGVLQAACDENQIVEPAGKRGRLESLAFGEPEGPRAAGARACPGVAGPCPPRPGPAPWHLCPDGLRLCPSGAESRGHPSKVGMTAVVGSSVSGADRMPVCRGLRQRSLSPACTRTGHTACHGLCPGAWLPFRSLPASCERAAQGVLSSWGHRCWGHAPQPAGGCGSFSHSQPGSLGQVEMRGGTGAQPRGRGHIRAQSCPALPWPVQALSGKRAWRFLLRLLRTCWSAASSGSRADLKTDVRRPGRCFLGPGNTGQDGQNEAAARQWEGPAVLLEMGVWLGIEPKAGVLLRGAELEFMFPCVEQ